MVMISFLLFCAPPFLCLCWLWLDSISWWAEESLSDCTSLYTSWGFHHLCLLPEQLDHQKLGALHCYIDTCRVTPLNGCLCFCRCSFSASRITLRCHLFCHQWSCYRDYLFLFVWINNQTRGRPEDKERGLILALPLISCIEQVSSLSGILFRMWDR